MVEILKDSIEVYHQHPFISSSQLKHIRKSPQHFINHLINKKPSNESQKFGSLVHDSLLEIPLSDYVVEPNFGDQRSKSNKEAKLTWLEAHQGRPTVSQSDYNALLRIKENIDAHPMAKDLLTCSGGQNEMSIYFTHEGEGFRARPDRFFGGDTLIEIKTTRDPQAKSFIRDIDSYDYDYQLYFYKWALEIAGVKIDQCFIIAIENEAPYSVCVYEMGRTIMSRGFEKLARCIEMYLTCKKTNSWAPLQNQNFETLDYWT